MKKLLALVLALLMVLGCMSITAFAEVSYTLELDGAQAVYAITGSPTENRDLTIQSWTDDVRGTLVDESSLSTSDVDNWSAYYEKLENTLSTSKFTGSEGYFSHTNSVELGIVSILVLALTDSNVLAPGASYVVYYGTCDMEGGAITLENLPIATGKLCTDAPAEEGKSGDTDITLTVAKPLYYDIVIPTNVTDLNNFGVFSVGQAKVENVENATEKTVISYTATTTDFTSEGKTAIPATYYTDESGQNAFPTTAVEVYKNKSDVASLPTMWVKITEDAWNAAENGTYTATVTFNFSVEERLSVGDVLATAEKKTPTADFNSFEWMNSNGDDGFITKDDGLYFYQVDYKSDTSYIKIFPLDFVLSADGNNYKGVNSELDDTTLIFKMTEGKLTSIEIDHYDGTFVQTEVAELGDVLDTANGSFPTAEEYGWTNQNGWNMFKYVNDTNPNENSLKIKKENSSTSFSLTLLLTQIDGKYKYTNLSGTYKFNMEDEHLISIEADMVSAAATYYDGIGGTYYPYVAK